MQDHNVLFIKLQHLQCLKITDQGHLDMKRAEIHVIASQKLKCLSNSRQITYRLIERYLRAVELRAW